MTRLRTYCPFCAGRLGPLAGSRQDCSRCATPFFHNAAPCVAVLVERDGRLLLARRSHEPARGKWDLPGGFANHDEAPRDAVLREIHEETGMRVAVNRFLGHVIDRYGDDGDTTLNCVYVARILSGEPHAADDVAELAWFAPGELPAADALAFANTAEAIRRWHDAQQGS